MSMHRYFIRLSYRGTAYHGWQIQPGCTTIQETLEQALSTILRNKINITGCGRTDTGVHASFFIAHFDSPTELTEPGDKLLFRINNYLPADIEIQQIFPVEENAHARFDAIARTYEYHIIRHKDPFNGDLAWKRYGQLSLKTMNRACDILMEYKDFTSFSKLHTDVKTNNCHITHARWFENQEGYIFIIRADRFLRNMVRAIVGTMTDTGSNKISCEDFRKIIKAKDRSHAGMSAPAHGLYLSLVEYPYTLD